jgi:NADPH:quinone reductase-like Zn-dependent oxidoreductase
MFLQRYPNVLGTDVAGEIHEVGEGVSQFKKGDRVLGYRPISNSPHHYPHHLVTSSSSS